MSQQDSMFVIDDLTKTFGDFVAVDHVSFDVKRGEVMGFLGPNGAGKSTTMKVATGFIPPTTGTARICGLDITRDPIGAKARIGYLPEGAPTYGDMSPATFLKFIAAARGYTGAERAQRIDRVVELLGLEPVFYKPIDTLSKGYKRRVGLAQAMLHDPDVLILDEPTDGLDPVQKRLVRDLIRQMAREKAIIISTHLLDEVDAVCSRTVIISKGKKVFDGTPKQLAAKGDLEDVFRNLAATVDDTIKAPKGKAPKGKASKGKASKGKASKGASKSGTGKRRKAKTKTSSGRSSKTSNRGSRS